MKSMTFFAPGEVKGQPRPRAFRRGSHAGFYNPKTADGWRKSVRLSVLAGWDRKPFVGPVRVAVTALFRRPKWHTNSKGAVRPSAPRTFHTAKPDADNVGKAILDEICQIEPTVFGDDANVSELVVRKLYANPGDEPGATITITQIEETPEK